MSGPVCHFIILSTVAQLIYIIWSNLWCVNIFFLVLLATNKKKHMSHLSSHIKHFIELKIPWRENLFPNLFWRDQEVFILITYLYSVKLNAVKFSSDGWLRCDVIWCYRPVDFIRIFNVGLTEFTAVGASCTNKSNILCHDI